MGTSFVSSCSWRAFVAVATTTRRPEESAGTRYARLLPVPVPASASRCSPASSDVGDCLGELGLLRARLVAGQGVLEGASHAEHVVHAASVWSAAAVAGKSSLASEIFFPRGS